MTKSTAIDEGAPAYLVAMKFGSKTEFARALGKTPSTSQRWLVNGFIPGEYHSDVIAAAKARGVSLTPTDFVDMRLFAK